MTIISIRARFQRKLRRQPVRSARPRPESSPRWQAFQRGNSALRWRERRAINISCRLRPISCTGSRFRRISRHLILLIQTRVNSAAGFTERAIIQINCRQAFHTRAPKAARVFAFLSGGRHSGPVVAALWRVRRSGCSGGFIPPKVLTARNALSFCNLHAKIAIRPY